jgi:UDP-3-O-[3-hydroxymyristoyl] N-acetylglucosamine deacetylase
MKEIKISGAGVHSGKISTMIIRPMKSGGIVFVRNGIRMPARYGDVSNTALRNTTIGAKPNKVQTIEHLMCALFVCGIANAEIEIDNAETPILDGSAKELINALKKLKTTGNSPYLIVKRPVLVHQREIIAKLPVLSRILVRIMNLARGGRPDGYVRLSPIRGRRLEISARIIYREPIIGDQSRSFVFDYDDFAKSAARFVREIAKSRTFGKVSEWEWLKRHNMGNGANEKNIIAVGKISEFDKLQAMGLGRGLERENIITAGGPDNDAVLNGLYYRDEFVRHKIIDAAGDLYTSGCRVVGKLESFKGGHALNNLVLRKLFSDPANYEIAF